MQTALVLPVMLLAAAGFILSAIAHVASIAGFQLPGGNAVFALHAGIFVVWIPTVLVARRLSVGINRRDFWKTALSGCPPWLRLGVQIIFGYALVNFFFFLTTTAAAAKHGSPSSMAEVRGFSGHWMIFYSAAFATMYSMRNRPELLLDRRCSNQHVVSIDAEYCQTCGERIPTKERGA